MSRSFDINLSFSGPVVLEKKIYYPIFAFLMPFEENLVLYLNNFEIPLPKDILLEV
jgi:hypothetical protein